MDSQRFDDLTRAFASDTSRRRVIKSLLGGVLGAALAAVPGLRRPAAAAPPCVGQLCLTSGECCGGTVCAAGTCQQAFGPCASAPLSPCGSDDDCCATEACVEGMCAAVQGSCVLGGECLSDEACCGGEVCADGVCVAASRQAGCPEGQIRCQEMCVDPLTDPANCGDCGVVCPSGQTCLNGTCVASGEPCGDTVCGPCEYCGGRGGGRCVPCDSGCFDCVAGVCINLCTACEVCTGDDQGGASCVESCTNNCAVCDPIEGCVSTCNACESCTFDSSGAYCVEQCDACSVCDPLSGCISACSGCERCDSETGTCVDVCAENCAQCVNGICEPLCGICENCVGELATGFTCVPVCSDPCTRCEAMPDGSRACIQECTPEQVCLEGVCV